MVGLPVFKCEVAIMKRAVALFSGFARADPAECPVGSGPALDVAEPGKSHAAPGLFQARS